MSNHDQPEELRQLEHARKCSATFASFADFERKRAEVAEAEIITLKIKIMELEDAIDGLNRGFRQDETLTETT